MLGVVNAFEASYNWKIVACDSVQYLEVCWLPLLKKSTFGDIQLKPITSSHFDTGKSFH